MSADPTGDSHAPLEAAELYAGGISELFRLIFPAVVGLVLYADPIVRSRRRSDRRARSFNRC